VLMAAKVVSVRAIAIKTKTITDAVNDSLIFGVFYPRKYSCILSLNKHYYLACALCT
jgi:hypothetical protein